MADIRQFNSCIWRATHAMPNGIPLHVHLIRGEEYAAWIDTGTASMYRQLQAMMEEAECPPEMVGVILQTHPHYDHIGCTGRLRKSTGALVAGHASHAEWHRDFEAHVRLYALQFPDITEDNTALRAGILQHLDDPHPLDVHIEEGTVFDLGGCQLETFHFSGHVAHELGFFERSSKTLLLGDTLTLLEAPILYGHVTVGGYRKTLQKIADLLDALEIKQVLLAHYPPKSAGQIRDLIQQTEAYLDRIDTIVKNLITGHQVIPLQDLWQAVCKTMDRSPDYRALRTIEAHVRGLIHKGKVKALEPLVYGPAE